MLKVHKIDMILQLCKTARQHHFEYEKYLKKIKCL